MAAPAPLAPVGAAAAPATAAETAAAAAPSVEEQFFAPATLRPIAQLPPAMPTARSGPGSGSGGGAGSPFGPGAGKWFALVAMFGFFVAAVATAWFTFGGASAQHPVPQVLAPRAPTAGLPTSLSTIVRIQAESTRRNALQAVEQIGSGDPSALAAVQPSYTWLPGDTPSTDAHNVSVAQNAGVITIAVSASSRDVCAFGQWRAGGAPQYVTMEHQPACDAVDAPTIGWTTEAGGAASDLPDDNG
jgi:hypothetical protein